MFVVCEYSDHPLSQISPRRGAEYREKERREKKKEKEEKEKRKRPFEHSPSIYPLHLESV